MLSIVERKLQTIEDQEIRDNIMKLSDKRQFEVVMACGMNNPNAKALSNPDLSDDQFEALRFIDTDASAYSDGTWTADQMNELYHVQKTTPEFLELVLNHEYTPNDMKSKIHFAQHDKAIAQAESWTNDMLSAIFC